MVYSMILLISVLDTLAVLVMVTAEGTDSCNVRQDRACDAHIYK